MPEDTLSIAVLVIGPVTITLLAGALILWLRQRGNKGDSDPPGGPQGR